MWSRDADVTQTFRLRQERSLSAFITSELDSTQAVYAAGIMPQLIWRTIVFDETLPVGGSAILEDSFCLHVEVASFLSISGLEWRKASLSVSSPFAETSKEECYVHVNNHI